MNLNDQLIPTFYQVETVQNPTSEDRVSVYASVNETNRIDKRCFYDVESVSPEDKISVESVLAENTLFSYYAERRQIRRNFLLIDEGKTLLKNSCYHYHQLIVFLHLVGIEENQYQVINFEKPNSETNYIFALLEEGINSSSLEAQWLYFLQHHSLEAEITGSVEEIHSFIEKYEIDDSNRLTSRLEDDGKIYLKYQRKSKNVPSSLERLSNRSSNQEPKNKKNFIDKYYCLPWTDPTGLEEELSRLSLETRFGLIKWFKDQFDLKEIFFLANCIWSDKPINNPIDLEKLERKDLEDQMDEVEIYSQNKIGEMNLWERYLLQKIDGYYFFLPNLYRDLISHQGSSWFHPCTRKTYARKEKWIQEVIEECCEIILISGITFQKSFDYTRPQLRIYHEEEIRYYMEYQDNYHLIYHIPIDTRNEEEDKNLLSLLQLMEVSFLVAWQDGKIFRETNPFPDDAGLWLTNSAMNLFSRYFFTLDQVYSRKEIISTLSQLYLELQNLS